LHERFEQQVGVQLKEVHLQQQVGVRLKEVHLQQQVAGAPLQLGVPLQQVLQVLEA